MAIAVASEPFWQWLVAVETPALGGLLLILIRQMLGSEKKRAEKFVEIFRRLNEIEKKEVQLDDIEDLQKELKEANEKANTLQRKFEVCRGESSKDMQELKKEYQFMYDTTYSLRKDMTGWKLEVERTLSRIIERIDNMKKTK